MESIVIVILLVLVYFVRWEDPLADWTPGAREAVRALGKHGAPRMLTARYAVWINIAICSRCVVYSDGRVQFRIPLDLYYGTDFRSVRIPRSCEESKLAGLRDVVGPGMIGEDSVQILADDLSSALRRAGDIVGYFADTPGSEKMLYEFMGSKKSVSA